MKAKLFGGIAILLGIFVLAVVINFLPNVRLAVPAPLAAEVDFDIYTEPTYQSAGIIITLPPNSNGNESAELWFKRSGTSSYQRAHDFVKYDANNMASSLFFLSPGTGYDIQIVFNDPDGFSGNKEASFTTRQEFNIPSPLVLKTVGGINGDYADIQTAVSEAQPGWQIRVRPGVYSPVSISGKNGTSISPIVIIADSPDDKPIIDGQGSISNVVFVNNSSYIYWDGFEVTNGADKGFYLRASSNIVVRNSSVHDNGMYDILISKSNEFPGSSLLGGYHLIESNSVVGSTHGVQLDNNPGAATVIRNNTINSHKDSIKMSGNEDLARSMAENTNHVLALTGSDQNQTNHDTEVYGNTTFENTDDDIEMDGICVNCRVYENNFGDAINPVSIAPAAPGPFFFIRNTITGDWGEAGVKMNTAGSDTVPLRNIFIYHNTFVREDPGTMINLWYAIPGDHNVPLRNVVFRNNIFWNKVSGKMTDADYRDVYDQVNFDSNLWFTSSTDNIFEWFDGNSTLTYNSFSDFQAGTGMEAGGYFAEPNIDDGFVPNPGSLAIDNAERIFGINDSFTGSGPDIGAFESAVNGTPEPTATIEPTPTSILPTETAQITPTTGPPTATPDPTSTSILPTATAEATPTNSPPAVTPSATPTSVPPTPAPTDIIVNQPPFVDALGDLIAYVNEAISINAVVTDDGLPLSPGNLDIIWTVLSSEGNALYSSPNSIITDVTFDTEGIYFLQITASDGEFTTSDEKIVIAVNRPLDESELGFQWSLLSGPGQVIFEAPNEIRTEAFFEKPGLYYIRINITYKEWSINRDLTVRIK